MNHLPPEHIAEIRKAISKADEELMKIENGRPNAAVVDWDFLDPTVGGAPGPLALDDPRGEFHYFSTIKRALKIGLEEGIVPVDYTDYLIRAPSIIRGLLERDDSDRIG